MEHRKRSDLGYAVLLWCITLFYMGLIFYLSSQHTIPFVKLPRYGDKVVHMCAYIPLAFMFFLSMRKSGMRKYVFAAAFLFACVYGLTDEFHQSFVPGRTPEFGDFIADTIGAYLGSLGGMHYKTIFLGVRGFFQ
jgi:VanZ family protein